MLKTIASGFLIAALATPASAAQYWVMKDPATQKCTVVEQQPATPAIHHAFNRREEAQAAIARAVACGATD
jgi:hypothetical protein